MNSARRLRVAAIAAVFCLSMAPGADAAEQKTAMIGTLSNISGVVEVMPRGADRWSAAGNGMKVGSGDQINTGIDGTATLTFDNTVTEVRPLTQFTVGRAMKDADAFTTEMFLSVGKLVTKADKTSGRTNKFSVTTPSAVAGIRGTVQEIGFGAGFGTECKIEDGVGSVTPISPDQLPPAIQMTLGVGPAALAPGAGSKSAASAGQAAGQAAAGPPPASAVAQALDQWLSRSFDKVVGAAEEARPSAGAREEAAAAPAQEFAALSAADGQAVMVRHGEEASVQEGGGFDAVSDPLAALIGATFTNITAAGATAAELEAAFISTDVSDAPISQIANELAISDELLRLLLKDIELSGHSSDGGATSAEEIDLFGQPPAKPTN